MKEKEAASKHSDDKQPGLKKQWQAEQIILLAALACFIIFLWLITFLLFPILSNRTASISHRFVIVEATPEPGFTLPPTWTATPGQPPEASPLPTNVFDGTIPTPLYTPRPTSLSGIPMPIIAPRLSVVDLARIMQGESPGDKQAAYMVGWVAKNRLIHAGYGDTYAIVSHGFFGYRADLQPNKEFIALARQVIRSREDPTGGAMYALSRTDITKLGIPPTRADVAYGEWFFFRTWPLSAR